MNNKIDIVILYCDCDNKEWRNSIKPYIKNDCYEAFRFKRLDLLKYVLRSIDMYMDKNILGDIYLVVANKSEVPNDIINVNVITHSEIIPNEFLPLFNPGSIELFISRIPNLREHFIYFNDDMLLNSNVSYSDFYDEHDNPIIAMHYVDYKYTLNTYHIQLNNDYNLAAFELNKPQNDSNGYYNNDHCPTPMLKSVNNYLLEKYYDKLYNSVSRFRESKNYTQSFFRYYNTLKNGNLYSKQSKYIDAQLQNIHILEETLQSNNYYSFCLSVNERTHNNEIYELKNKCNNLLNNKYNIISKYESKSMLIIYMGTGHYIDMLYYTFLPYIKNFCPAYKKHICILTDKELDKKYFNNLNENITYDSYYIEFLPWPITTMIKHVYMYKYASKYNNFDYLCYFNANSLCLEKDTNYWNTYYNDLETYDFLLSKYHFNLTLTEERQNYIIGGYLIGKYDKVMSLCYEIGKIECNCLMERNIPEWHDETILNEYFNKGDHHGFNYKQCRYAIDGGIYCKNKETLKHEPIHVLICWYKSKFLKSKNYMDIIKQKKKRLVIVGNKLSENAKYKNFIDLSDIVIRINKMSNFETSGAKTDILHIESNKNYIDNLNDELIAKLNKLDNLQLITCTLFNQDYTNGKIDKLKTIKSHIPNNENIEIINLDEYSSYVKNEITPNDNINDTYITSVSRIIIFVMNCEKFKDYDKYLIFYDINRLHIDETTKNSCHIFKEEEKNYIQNLIDTNQLKYINVDNDTYFNTNEIDIFKMSR